ncbi:hypothetical protein N9B82_06465 [Saprospiraceae bacterium]|nr:hypothetical protein [Saprospiraceae bacterium]
MKKERLLMLIVVILILLNFFLIGSLWMKGNRPHPGVGGPQQIQKMFDFSEEQMVQFELLKDTHRNAIKPLRERLSKTSLSYFNIVDNSKITRDSILNEIHIINAEIYEANYVHFQDMKKMIPEEKYPELQAFIRRLLHKDGPPRPKKGNRQIQNH